MTTKSISSWSRAMVDAYVNRGRLPNPPAQAIIEPTNYCNLACPICPQSIPFSRRRGFMSIDTYSTIVGDCRGVVDEFLLTLHGEPFLHPQLAEMVRMANDAGILVILFTNGLGITDDKWREVLRVKPYAVTFSMDLISPRSYCAYKGCERHEYAATRLATYADIRQDEESATLLAIQAMYGGESAPEVSAFLGRWLTTPGIESVKVTHPLPWPGTKDADDLARSLGPVGKTACPVVSGPLSVFWDGRVGLCNYDVEAKLLVGNIHNAPLPAIANSDEARRLRRLHALGRRAKLSPCSTCLIPQFAARSVTVTAADYRKMAPEERKALVERIRDLRPANAPLPA